MKVSKIIKVGSSYCGPCRQLKKELDGFNYVSLEEIDADENPNFCNIYNIKSIPVIVFLDSDNNEVGRHIGFITKQQLIDKINAYEVDK